jgi:hypothetical protein
VILSSSLRWALNSGIVIEAEFFAAHQAQSGLGFLEGTRSIVIQSSDPETGDDSSDSGAEEAGAESQEIVGDSGGAEVNFAEAYGAVDRVADKIAELGAGVVAEEQALDLAGEILVVGHGGLRFADF